MSLFSTTLLFCLPLRDEGISGKNELRDTISFIINNKFSLANTAQEVKIAVKPVRAELNPVPSVKPGAGHPLLR